jgi:hypothetical protein
MAKDVFEEIPVDIRPTSVDILVTLSTESVAVRRQRAEELVALFDQRCAALRATLERDAAVHRFLVQERDNAILVQRLQEGIVVRVVCQRCKGSGFRPSDVLSGQLNRKSAFETIGEPVKRLEPIEAPEAERCEECGGKRWVLMERYCG